MPSAAFSPGQHQQLRANADGDDNSLELAMGRL
jgi:hypothetical protein